MRVSFEWLGDFVDTDGLTPHQAADLLTFSGTKIEAVQVTDLQAIIVGRVLEQRGHPTSNKPLWIHQVDVGDGRVVQIIAGAPNAIAGTLVPVALPGVTVPNGRLVRDGKIAGEAAQGMLCSSEELLLGVDSEPRIMILDAGQPGESLSTYIPTEAVFEAEITPNRPDCLGHLGIARELAAAAGREMKVDFMAPFVEGVDPAGGELIRVTIEEPDLCRRYIGAPVTALKVGPSPDWVQRRLRAAGVRPISNVVDASAYVMLEYGQPTHVFDLRRLAGSEIIVRRARPGESLLCLDGQERSLGERILVIADSERPVAIAGVIGGEQSSVTETTVDVLLEVANFDGVHVRATSRALALRTEASSRFEKGLPPELALAGARRAAALLQQWAGGVVHRDWPDQYPRPQEPVRVHVDPPRVDALLGVHIPLEESQVILRRLGFHVRTSEDGAWDVLPPVFRNDVELAEDIVEEIGRIHGVDRIPPTLPGERRGTWVPARAERPGWVVREVLTGAGFDEVVTPALTARRLLERLGLAEGARSVINPMSEDYDTMRTSLLPSLLQVAVLNQDRSGRRVSVFELARVYLGSDAAGLADEPERLAVVTRTSATPEAGRGAFLRLKAAFDRLAFELRTPVPEYRPAGARLFHPARAASVMVAGSEIGTIGELHPSLLAEFGLDGRAAALDLDLAGLLASAADRKAAGLPRFPAVERDLAVVVGDGVSAAQLAAAIRAAGGELLAALSAFDEYRSEGLGEGSRSLAYSLTFRSPERTLTDSEVDQLMASIWRRLEADHGARAR